MYELYSRRISNNLGEPEVYSYDSFPIQFRTQVLYILADVLNYCSATGLAFSWTSLHNSFAREIGVKTLYSGSNSPSKNIEFFFDTCGDIDFLDFLDFAFAHIVEIPSLRSVFSNEAETVEIVNRAVNELNHRFVQHNLGYEFIDGQVIRKDSEHMHQEVIKPALRLLIENGFEGAEQEFLDAFEHRRKGENKDAILDALKAFESTMKAICDGMGYAYDSARSTAKDLIGILENNAFYPAYMNNHMTSLRMSLESGLPTMRNKNAGHGQGAAVVNVSDEFTEYALNLAATNIVLLTKIYASKKAGGA